MTTILAGGKRDLDHTLDLVFPDASAFHFATSPLTAVNSNNYTNDLESVGEIRQTLESATDRVAVGIQNKDRVLGQHVALYWQKWRQATAVIGRNYYQKNDAGDRTGTTEWIEAFRGVVQRPNADDLHVTFDIVPDTISPGQIVCNRTEDPACWFVFKGTDCGYSGGLTTCNHHLASSGGCDGRANSHRFGGMEHRYDPDVNIPGTGGNDDPGGGLGGIGGGGGCPRLDQYTKVRDQDGKAMVKMVCFVTDEDWIWNPLRNRFYKVASTEIIRNVPIWELITMCGAVGFSSGSHPIIRSIDDKTGLAIERFRDGQPVVVSVGEKQNQSRTLLHQNTGETGDVLRITMEAETDAERIYCSGDNPEKLIDCHNRKADPTDELPIYQ